MYTYDIRSVVGVYTPVGVATEWLWSVHSKLECTLRQGKGIEGFNKKYKFVIPFQNQIIYYINFWFRLPKVVTKVQVLAKCTFYLPL